MDSIPLLAHSMGGIVARLATRLPTASPYIKTVLTLSTPHAAPPAPIESGLESIYSLINTPHPRDGDTLLISLSGGLLDTQLPSELAILPYHFTSASNMSILRGFTADLPGLWSSVDHLAMMWCDQLRRRLSWTMGNEVQLAQKDKEAGRVELRKKTWARALGLRGVGRPSLGELIKGAPIIEVERGEQVHDFPLQQGHEEFQLLTDLALGKDYTVAPGPGEQETELHVFACVDIKDSDKAGCRPLPPWSFDIVPTKSAGNSFPMAEALYDQPGNAARLLRLRAEEMGEYTSIKVVRPAGKQMGFWRAAWVRPKDQSAAPPLVQSYDLSPSSSGSHSTLFVYDVTFSSTCTPNPAFAPFAHFYSLRSGDGRWMPADTAQTQSLHMHFADDVDQPMKLDIYSDGCRFTNVTLQPRWSASVGLWVSRFRWAAYAWCFAPFALVLILAHARPEKAKSPSDLASLGMRSLAVLYGCTALLALLAPAQLLGVRSNVRLTVLASSALLILTFGILTALILIIGGASWLVARLPFGQRLAFPSSSGNSKTAMKARRSTLVGIGLLCIAIKLALPYQFVFLACTLVQIINVVRSARSAATATSKDGHSHTRFVQQSTLLLHLLLLLPLKAATLLVFARNFLAGYFTPSFPGGAGLQFGEDHDLWRILPVLGVVQVAATGRMFEIGGSGDSAARMGRLAYALGRYAVPGSFAWLAGNALLRGARRPYVCYDASMLCLTAVLAAHYAARFAQQKQDSSGGSSTANGIPMELGRTQRARRMREEEEREEVERKLLRGDREEQVIMPFEVPDGIDDDGEDEAKKEKATAEPSEGTHAGSSPAAFASENDVRSEQDSPALAAPAHQHSHLDELLLLYLTKIDAYQRLQTQLTTHLTTGFLALSKGRMSSTTSVTRWEEQVRGLIDGQRRAETVLDGEGRLEAREARGWEVEDEGQEVVEQVAGEEKGGEEKQGLRQRRKGKSNITRTAEPGVVEDEKTGKPVKDDDDDAETRSSKSHPAPLSSLHRFASLPSPSVRRAATSFGDVLRVVAAEEAKEKQNGQGEAESAAVRAGLATLVREMLELEGKIRRERERLKTSSED